MIQSSVAKVDNGTRFVGDAGKTMDDIVGAVKEVSTIISDISGASQEQLTGIEQVNRAIIEMDTSTQQNAAMVEQSTTAAAQMADQARELVTAVARFKLEAASRAPAFAATPAVAPATLSPTLPAAAGHPALPRRAAANTAQNSAQKADGEWKEF